MLSTIEEQRSGFSGERSDLPIFSFAIGRTEISIFFEKEFKVEMTMMARAVRQTAPILATATRCSLQARTSGACLVFRVAAYLGAKYVPVSSFRGGYRYFATTTGILKTATALSERSRGGSKVWASADEAVADIESGSVLLSSGFGLCGIAC